jgi:hypothetical protein
MIKPYMPFKHRKGSPQRLARLGLSAFPAQHICKGPEGYGGIEMFQAEARAADVEGILEGGKRGIVVSAGSVKLTEEMHGSCVLGTPHTLFAAE